MDLSYRSDRDSSYNHANDIAEQVGYLAHKVGENQLEVIGQDDEHYLITYDNTEQRMVNVERPPQRTKESPNILPMC